MSDETLQDERHGHGGRLAFDRPEAGRARRSRMWDHPDQIKDRRRSPSAVNRSGRS